MILILFTLLVLLGFIFRFAATFPVPAIIIRLAWGCWLGAAILWAFTSSGLHVAAHGA